MQKNKTDAAATTLALPEFRTGQSIELLKALHILTVDGKMNQDSRRKLKQVYHLVQFIEPLLAQVLAERGSVTLVDHGAGKSYLGFILYDLFFKAIAAQYPANKVWESRRAQRSWRVRSSLPSSLVFRK